jgi:hypothetical protein
VSLAARGARNMDSGIERIEDEELARQLRNQAQRIYIKAAPIAAALTALSLFVP